MTDIRDRIIDLRRIPGRDLQDNAGNWRLHPRFQRDSPRGVLGTVGIADALKAYHSQRYGGLTLLDGHLRKDEYPDVEWPVLLLDIGDEEADLLLTVFDPVGALAEMDRQKIIDLTERVTTDDLAVRELVMRLHDEAQKLVEEVLDEEAAQAEETAKDGPPEMDLQPFEHYDYIVLMFKTTFDFEHALDLLGIERVGFTVRSSHKYDETPRRKIGLGRVLDGAAALDKLCKR